jgi:DNA modification methylase
LTQKLKDFLGKIHHGDCIDNLQRLPDGTVDLVFADPPFNIGYKYDQYDDRLEDDRYLAWSHDWMSEIFRVLQSSGAFWLAIGDEYAAELKITAKNIGFHCRSWVIWYYTFGVHCEKKFTRSHAHLFHFVKDKSEFVFNHMDKDLRVPSARQLVYNDARANPKGRMPDDTWILRPQDLTDGFNPDEDTWYFPRVAGTFKEREGFHGCQMPEQLLGRIIRACSNPNDIVVDPFSGSATTLAVAKKLGRRFFGFELSDEYVKLGSKRLDQISIGDRLDGSDEPKVSAPNTHEKRSKKSKQQDQMELFADDRLADQPMSAEVKGIVEAFAHSNRGYSVDRLVVDPLLNEDFQLACDRLSVPGTSADRNRFLFRIRKTGKLKSLDINTSIRTNISWNDVGSFIDASEIAWRQISNKYCMSLDELFCDPRIAAQFDAIASSFAPGHQCLDYRWAALKLRKEGSNARLRTKLLTPKQFGIDKLKKRQVRQQPGITLDQFDPSVLPNGPGVYLVQSENHEAIYAGETDNLLTRLSRVFDPDGPRELWTHYGQIQIYYHAVDSVTDYRLARQSLLLKWHQPQWNSVKELAA